MSRTTKDVSNLINYFVDVATSAAASLGRRHHLPIQCEHVEAALVHVLSLSEPIDLLDFEWTEHSILVALSDFNFHKFFPEFLDEVKFKSSVIPPGTRRRLLEQTARVNGEIWRVYRNEADPFPSNPHAHNIQSGEKLHLGTGELFLKRHPIGKIKRKHLIAIRQYLTNLNLPRLG